MEVTARSAVDVIGVHPNTAALFYHQLREIIAKKITDDVPFDGEIEVDESYFGGVRKGKRGRRDAAGKVPVFGVLKRGSKVYADGYRSYNVLEHRGSDIFASTIFLILLMVTIISMAFKTSETRAKRILRKYNGTPRKKSPS